MKVLLLLKSTNMVERHGVMMLGAALKSGSHQVKLAVLDLIGINGLFDVIRRFSPDIIGYSVMTGEEASLLTANRILKSRYKFLSVFGGPHATFYPEIVNEDGCDAVCVGEGENSLLEFCNRLDGGGDYWKTGGFIVKHAGQIWHNPVSPLIKELDHLAFADRDLLYEAAPFLKDSGAKMFFSGRGCPYACTYCFNREYNRIYADSQILRYRSCDNFVEEIAVVKDMYPLKLVWINDDNFLLKPSGWFVRFASLYRKKIGLPFSCNLRADLVDDENIGLLRSAGLDWVVMGIESGDEKISQEVLSRGISNSQLEQAAAIIKKHGVRLYTQNITGLPVKESYAADLKTLDFNIRIRPAFANAALMYPYPGTEISAYARRNGFLREMAGFPETNKQVSLFDLPRVEKRRVENLQKLFPLLVMLPFMRRLSDFLCDLPLRRLYSLIYYTVWGLALKLRFLPFGSLRKEVKYYL